MNIVRRGIGLLMPAAVALGMLASCDDVGERAGPVTVEPGEAAPPFEVDEWTELPPSPVGDWPQYNWVWLADGSGFVHAGGARMDGDGRITTTAVAAWFSFDERRYEQLPEIPVSSGVGAAGGAWIGDTLVLLGQDCPPSPGASMYGVDFCAAGGAGTKVVLTLQRGADRWERHDVPEWLDDYEWGSPRVLGVSGGKLLAVATGPRPAHLGSFDPADGSWARLPDAPVDARSTSPDATVTTVYDPVNPAPYVPYVGPTEVCLVGDDLVAWLVADSYVNEWWRLVNGAWASMAPALDTAATNVACARHGVYVTRRPVTPGPNEISWVDPIARTSTVVAPSIDETPTPDQATPFGDLLPLPALYAAGVPTTQVAAGGPTQPAYVPIVRYLSPTSLVTTGLRDEGATLVGDWFVQTNDVRNDVDGTEPPDRVPPRIALAG